MLPYALTGAHSSTIVSSGQQNGIDEASDLPNPEIRRVRTYAAGSSALASHVIYGPKEASRIEDTPRLRAREIEAFCSSPRSISACRPDSGL